MRREEKNREMKRALIRELPQMLVIGIGLYAWALILWMVAV